MFYKRVLLANSVVRRWRPPRHRRPNTAAPSVQVMVKRQFPG